MGNARGLVLIEIFAKLFIVAANVGCVPSFRATGLKSCADLTYLRISLLRIIVCETIKYNTRIYYSAIFLDIEYNIRSGNRRRFGNKKKVRWLISRPADELEFAQNIQRLLLSLRLRRENVGQDDILD